MKFQKETLSNGLRLILAPLNNTQIVTVLFLVGVGSKYETKKINGISHFLEHMVFKGTKKRPTALKINEVVDKVGGEFNAFTSKEATGFYIKIDKRYLDLALDVISDILLNSKFENKEINKERGVIIEEINFKQDTPIRQVGDLFEKLLYGDQPAGWEIIGEKENILKLNRPDILNYFKVHYLANNSILCLAGAINDRIKLKVDKYFARFETGQLKNKIKVKEEQIKPQALVSYKKTDQTHLCLGTRAYDLFHPDRYALKVLGVILGGNMSSRLFNLVREKYGLAYYIRTNTETYTDSGYLVTQAGVDNKKVKQVIKLILSEYKKIKKTKVNQTELKKAKDYIKGVSLINLETSDEVAHFLATQEILTRKILTIEEQFAAIDKVTTRDIERVAQDIFKPSKLNLAIIGPFEKKEEFAKILSI
ncbi:MAG: pitrilysin family protein [bacterium]